MQAGVGAAKTIMMTMIPVDYHTCFIAISQHAKILYANESMANLLGRKVAEISNKMSLPQLMTIPCQQLHQNFFKVQAQSHGCGTDWNACNRCCICDCKHVLLMNHAHRTLCLHEVPVVCLKSFVTALITACLLAPRGVA